MNVVIKNWLPLLYVRPSLGLVSGLDPILTKSNKDVKSVEVMHFQA